MTGRVWRFRDISIQKKTEGALKQSEAKFASFFNAAPIWMVLATRDEGRYLEVNRAFMETTGYTRDEVIGRTSTEIGIWATSGDRREAIDLLQKRGRLDAYPVRFRMKDGRRRDPDYFRARPGHGSRSMAAIVCGWQFMKGRHSRWPMTGPYPNWFVTSHKKRIGRRRRCYPTSNSGGG